MSIYTEMWKSREIAYLWYQVNKPKRVAKQDFARAMRRGEWKYQVTRISSELRFTVARPYIIKLI